MRLSVRLSPPTRLRLIGPRTFLLFFFLSWTLSNRLKSFRTKVNKGKKKEENVEFKLYTQLSVCVCVVFYFFISGARI